MRITEGQLRRIIKESILFEGFKDDQRWLINKYPEHAQDLSALQPKWIAWLTARFGEKARISEDEPFESAIVTVRNFSGKDSAIMQKYRDSEQFRNAVDGRFLGRSPNDPTTMTVDDLKKILGFLERKKQRIDINDAGDIEKDRIGKVGQWNIFMPTTRENSCKIVSDPVTGKPQTNWCTASTDTNNPFYGYVAVPNSHILFTLVRDKRKGDAYDFMSFGFYKSKLFTTNQESSITVDGRNMGLTLPKIRSILGSDFDEIMRILNEKVQSLSGVHPAVKKFEDASKSLIALEYFLRGLGGQEAASAKIEIARQKYTTAEVLVHLSTDKSEKVRRSVSQNLNLPIEFLAPLSRDVSAEVRIGVANNKKITPDIAEQLSNDPDTTVRYCIAKNTKTDSSILTRLASDKSALVRAGVTSNPKTSIAVLANLINDKDNAVAAGAVRNEKTPIDAVINLSKSQDETRRMLALQRKNLPKDVLVGFSKDPSFLVRRRAVSSEEMRSIDLLSLFLNDENPEIRFTANYYIKKLEKKSKNIKSENLLRDIIRRMR
jgi:hypothetical protein